jgi:hypothetical protein
MIGDTSLTALKHRLTEVRDSMSDRPGRCHFRRRQEAPHPPRHSCSDDGWLRGNRRCPCFTLPAGQAPAVPVHVATWSVDTTSNGTVTVTVHELTHMLA